MLAGPEHPCPELGILSGKETFPVLSDDNEKEGALLTNGNPMSAQNFPGHIHNNRVKQPSRCHEHFADKKSGAEGGYRLDQGHSQQTAGWREARLLVEHSPATGVSSGPAHSALSRVKRLIRTAARGVDAILAPIYR